MNRNILILSVLMALTPTAFTNASDQAAAPATAQAAAPAGTTAPQAPKDDVKITKVDGRDIIKNDDGSLAAYICVTGMDCRKQVLTTKSISDTAAISKEIQASIEKANAEKVAKVEPKKEEAKKDEFDVKDYTKDLITDLEESVLEQCDIETRSSRISRRDDDDLDIDRPSWARVSSRSKNESRRQSVALTNRFNSVGISEMGIDQASTDTYKCAEAFQEKLDELTSSFDEDLLALGLEEEDLYDLGEISKNLNSMIRKEKDPKKKEALELASSKLKALNNKVTATQITAQKFARSSLLPHVENDLARTAGYGHTYLHEMVATTPDFFSGVRKEAATSILEVYRKQIRSHISLRDAGNLQESTRIGLQASNYNRYMSEPLYIDQATGRRVGPSAGQQFLARHAKASDLDPESVLNDVYSVYSPASAQIQDYLASTATGGAQSKAVPLPGVLSQNAPMTTEAGFTSNRLQPSAQTVIRTSRSQNQMGTMNQPRTRLSIPAPNGPPRLSRQGF